MADVRLTATNPEDSSVVPVACDAAGRLLLEEPQVIEGPQGPPGPRGEQGPPGQNGQDGSPGQDGDPFSGNFAGDVTFGGSATFANLLSVTGGGISCQYGGIGIYAGEPFEKQISLNTDGSATFAGLIAIDYDNFTSGDQSYDLIKGSNSAASYVLGLYTTSNGTPGTFYNKTGNAPFLYEVGGASRLAITNNGSVRIGGTVEEELGVAPNINLNAADGAATFAGNKAGFTAEGYLWCTTRRGDTVILDFTSNGAGQWVEYTPTTRIEEIRDNLDANRGDTGEMPADTP